MKRATMGTPLLVLTALVWCAGSGQLFKFLEEPSANGIMVVGNVIVENVNQEFGFHNWDLGMEVVLIGKDDRGEMKHYVLNTNDQGYFCLPNAPSGQYALKAVVLPMPGGKPIKLVNDLEERNSAFYRMRHSELPIEYTAPWLPQKQKGRIVNLNILWLGLRADQIQDLSSKSVGEIFMAKVQESIQSKRFYDKGYPFTREDPVAYFKTRFPDSGWWKINPS